MIRDIVTLDLDLETVSRVEGYCGGSKEILRTAAKKKKRVGTGRGGKRYSPRSSLSLVAI
jgi:hypothetical protein